MLIWQNIDMKKKSYSAVEHFRMYLAQNRDRFRMGLEITEQGKDTLELIYPGFIAEIRPFLAQRGSYVEITVNVHHKGEIWDCLASFEVEIKKSRTGEYYCGLCEADQKICYSSTEELIEVHCFEEFRRWSNRNILRKNCLALYGSRSGGTTSARIITPGSTKQPVSPEETVIPLAGEQ